MDYLVTMTTHVPAGTSDAAVQAIRAREAVRSRELATRGHLLRLWRPPLQPGEWRTLGLFAADDGAQLEEILASMPLRVWRTDEVTPLSPHPDDPALQAERPRPPAAEAGDTAAEFLTAFTVTVPAGTSGAAGDAATAGDAGRGRGLAAQGHLLRLWTLPGEGRALGLWRARDAAGMREIVASLPLLSAQTTPLTPHPSDPALTGT
ncbi:MAG: hypothetical protein V7637_765 [Mycobacteriales bacterium]